MMFRSLTAKSVGCHLKFAACLLGLSVLGAQAAQGAIMIQLAGLDIGYNGSTIVDQSPNGANPDPLTYANFIDDSTNTTIGSVTSNLTLNLSIPGVLNIPVAGGSVFSSTGGTFDLDFGGGDFLSLSLGSAGITYQKIVAGPLQFKFVFAGAVASIVGQHLPFQAVIGDPISVSFSTQINPGSIHDNGSYLTAFTASGTGEVRSDQYSYVPEPATIGLLALGGLALIRRRR